MTQPVTYIEFNTPDLEATKAFMTEVFDWEFQPFASAEYLVAPHGDEFGVDTGAMPSRDGQPRTLAVIRVSSLEKTLAAVGANGGTLVVEPFTIEGVGRACYITDPSGLIIGLHEYHGGST